MPSYVSRHLIGFLTLISLCFTFAGVVGDIITYWPGNPGTYPYGPTFPVRNRFIEWFGLDLYRTIPAWYTAMLFLSGAVLLLMNARRAGRGTDAFRPYWTTLGAVFLILSVTKVVKPHLPVPEPVRLALNAPWTVWIIPGLYILLVFLRFLIRLPSATRWSFILSGVLLAGASAVDGLGEAFAAEHSGHHMVAALLGDAEGTLEMLGAVALIYGATAFRRREF